MTAVRSRALRREQSGIRAIGQRGFEVDSREGPITRWVRVLGAGDREGGISDEFEGNLLFSSDATKPRDLFHLFMK